jgi:hypothetical protein
MIGMQKADYRMLYVNKKRYENVIDDVSYSIGTRERKRKREKERARDDLIEHVYSSQSMNTITYAREKRQQRI